MNFYKIYIDVIGPIVCSIIGGICTVLGVYLTIKYEKNKEKSEFINNNKPLFYRLDPMQEYDYKSAITYIIGSKNDYIFKIQGIFKNTEKALIVVKYILLNNKKYYSLNGNVIDKDKIFYLDIFIDEKLKTDDELILVITDIYNNEYRYKLEFDIYNDERKASVRRLVEMI